MKDFLSSFCLAKCQDVYIINNGKGNILGNYFRELRKKQKAFLAAEGRDVSHEF